MIKAVLFKLMLVISYEGENHIVHQQTLLHDTPQLTAGEQCAIMSNNANWIGINKENDLNIKEEIGLDITKIVATCIPILE